MATSACARGIANEKGGAALAYSCTHLGALNLCSSVDGVRESNVLQAPFVHKRVCSLHLLTNPIRRLAGRPDGESAWVAPATQCPLPTTGSLRASAQEGDNHACQ
jgi:hypothetical protein